MKKALICENALSILLVAKTSRKFYFLKSKSYKKKLILKKNPISRVYTWKMLWVVWLLYYEYYGYSLNLPGKVLEKFSVWKSYTCCHGNHTIKEKISTEKISKRNRFMFQWFVFINIFLSFTNYNCYSSLFNQNRGMSIFGTFLTKKLGTKMLMSI